MKCPCCSQDKLVESKSDTNWYVCSSCGVRVMKEHIKEN